MRRAGWRRSSRPRRRTQKRRGAVSLSWVRVLFGIVVVFAAYWLWRRFLWEAAASATQENEAVRTLIQAFGATGLALGAYFTFRQLRIAKEGQITERFTRAITQLGDSSLEIRLGGIYALERIARDSPRDHWTIVEILTAFIRERASCRETVISGASTSRTEPSLARPSTDIQAILTVLGRRNRTCERHKDRLDLQRTDLRGADLQGVHLEDADLLGARMEWAVLWDAHLERVSLWLARLSNATFHGAHLHNATLQGAHLQQAGFMGAHMEGVMLQGAHLQGASLVRADLQRADLRGASLKGANLQEATLRWADFRGVDLSGVTNLTREQILSTKDWRGARLPRDMRNLELPVGASEEDLAMTRRNPRSAMST